MGEYRKGFIDGHKEADEEWRGKIRDILGLVLTKTINFKPIKTQEQFTKWINGYRNNLLKNILSKNYIPKNRYINNQSPSQQTSVVNREIVHTKKISNAGENPALDTNNKTPIKSSRTEVSEKEGNAPNNILDVDNKYAGMENEICECGYEKRDHWKGKYCEWKDGIGDENKKFKPRKERI